MLMGSHHEVWGKGFESEHKGRLGADRTKKSCDLLWDSDPDNELTSEWLGDFLRYSEVMAMAHNL
jgi:hypothetical protein